MRATRCLSIALILLSGAMLIGCGGGGGIGSLIGGAQPIDVSGSWSLSAVSAISTSTFEADGVLASTGPIVAGDFIVLSTCYFPSLSSPTLNQPTVPVAGTVDASGKLDLTSTSVNGQVLTVHAKVSSDGNSIVSGTYSVAGGCADKDRGTITGQRIASISGTYSGSATLGSPLIGPAAPIVLTTQITQGNVPEEFAYPVTGAITVTGTACFSKGTLMPISSASTTPSGGIVYGKRMGLFYAMDDGSTLGIAATDDPLAKTLTGVIVVQGGKCNLQSGSITLAQQ